MIIHNKKPLKFISKNLLIYFLLFISVFLIIYLIIFNFNPIFGPVSNYNSGIYSNSININLQNNIPNSVIRFTLDNRKPNKDSEIFKESIEISQTTVLRAQAFRNENPIGKESIFSYIIPNRELNLPVVNLIIDFDDLYDKKNGIYKNFLRHEYFKPAEFVYYDSSLKPQVTLKSKARIYGARSRSFPRKSFHVCFDNQNLNYKIFPNTPNLDYDCLTIRNSGNDFNSTFIRDSLVHNFVSENTNLYFQDSKFIILYLNNEYFGIYDIREPNNTNTLSLKYGGKKSDYALVYQFSGNKGEIRKDAGTKNDIKDFKILLNTVQSDLSDLNNRNTLENLMDVDYYFNYQIIQTYFRNYDYIIQNFKIFRFNGFLKEPNTFRDGKFRWLFYDTDVSLGFTNKKEDIFYLIMGNKINENGTWPYIIFSNLMKNDYYKSKFITMYVDNLNSKLLPDKVLSYVDKFSNSIRLEVPYHIKRWENFKYGQQERDDYEIPLKNIGDWEKNISEIRDFIKIRDKQVFKELDSNFSLGGTYILKIENPNTEMGYIKINSLEIKDNIWSGTYFNLLEPSVTPVPNDGYEFKEWQIDKKEYKKPIFKKL